MSKSSWTVPYTWTAGEEVTAAKMNQHLRDNLNALAPVGSLHWRMQAATSVETTIDGFALECNGVSVSRSSYSALNTKLSGLSYPFGTADGTHMTLPDVRGRSLVAMAASGHADVNALGDSDGIGTVASRTPKGSVSISGTTGAVSVTISGTTGAGSSHTHATTTGAAASGGFTVLTGMSPEAAHTHSFSGSGSGTGSFSGSGTVPGNYVVVGVICVKY